MDYIMTVGGPIPGEDLGVALAHEHLYCDLSPYSGKADNRFLDVPAVVEDLRAYRAAGGSSVLEMTTPGIGRSPSHLSAIGSQSGVNVVSGIALYDKQSYPDWVRTADEGALADYFVLEIEEGTEGVQAGFIGELLSHNDPAGDSRSYVMEDFEELVFSAAAQAQRRTGVGIATHASLGRPGLVQLCVLEKAGADLTKVAIGHCDAQWNREIEKDFEYYLAIFAQGAFCSFDMIGWTELMEDEQRAERVAALTKLGYAARILLSTDTCRLSHLKKNGGRGYDYVLRTFLPMLKSRGVTDTQIQSMLVDAPRSLLVRERG